MRLASLPGARSIRQTTVSYCLEAVADLAAGGARGGVTSAEVRQWIVDGGFPVSQDEVTAALRKLAGGQAPRLAVVGTGAGGAPRMLRWGLAGEPS